MRSYTAPGVEDLTKTQSYEYDAWSHLKRAYTTDLTQPGTWRLEWSYDRLGNRRNQSLTGGNTAITQPQLTISETTNRITTAGFAYDAAGNMTNDSLHSYTYDAEGRMTKVDNGTAATYTYVGASRVKKVAGSTTTVYVFSGSKVIAEYVNGAVSKEYVYSGSSLLATIAAGGATTYHHPDHLSTRVETDATGVVTRTFGQYPFGEVWYETGAANKWKFTSYERDSESGLDYAISRYDSSRLGRFMSPDALAGSLSNPQSLNRYAYVGNDPVNGVDPLGLKRPVDDDGIGGAGGVRIYLALGGGLSGGNYSIDGLDVPDSVAQAALRSGGAVNCPQCRPSDRVGADGQTYELVQVCVSASSSDPANRGTTQSCSWELLPKVGSPAYNDAVSVLTGLAPGDRPVGMDIFRNSAQCPTCGNIMGNTAGAVNTLAAGALVIPALVFGGTELAGAPVAASLTAVGQVGFSIARNPNFILAAGDFVAGAVPGATPPTLAGLAGLAFGKYVIANPGLWFPW